MTGPMGYDDGKKFSHSGYRTLDPALSLSSLTPTLALTLTLR